MTPADDEDAKIVALCAGVTAWALAYLGAAFLEAPLVVYFPERHGFRVVSHAPPEAITIGGLLLWGLVAGADAAVVTLAAARAAKRPPSPTFAAMCTGWTLLSLLLAAAFFALRARL